MPEQTCAVDGCDRPITARGWCNAHYQRVRRYGDPQPDRPLGHSRRTTTTRATCSVDDCTTTATSRGWCPKHYARWRTHGDPTAVSRGRGPSRARQKDAEIEMLARLREHGGYKPKALYTGRELLARLWRGNRAPDQPDTGGAA